ncbi:MAG: AI-2E family transporter [Firmicutes bacterium]|nr:AI-2E family transporter [Bacillota bacterium]
MKKGREIDKDGLNELIHLSKNLLRVVYVIVIVGIFLCGLIVLNQMQLLSFIIGALKVISPLFIGFIIAWLFYPLHRKMVDKGVNKVLSAFLIFLGIISFILLFIYIFIPVLYNQVNDLISYIPTVLSSVTDFITSNLDKFDIKGLDVSTLKDGLVVAGEDLIINITSSLPNGIIGIVKGLVSAIGTILISFVVGIYMLIDFDNLTVGFYKLLPKKNREEYITLFKNIGANARRVVNGTLLVAFMVFVCDTIGFAIVGLNAGVLFGLLCGITDLIPYIGPYIGGAAAVIVGFTQGPIVGVGVLIIVIIVQLVESYLLQPVVMSKAMQLHPVMIIVGLLLFGHLFGILGMVIATPCMAVIKEIILFIFHRNHVERIKG